MIKSKLIYQFSVKLGAVICVMISSFGCTEPSEHTAKDRFLDGFFISEMNNVLTESIMVDLFSPPVASRIYVYPNIACYEVLRFSSTNHHSFYSGLNELEPVPEPNPDLEIDYVLAALTAFVKTAKQLVYTEAYLIEFEKHKLDSLTKNLDQEIAQRSIDFGNRVADHILNWAAGDKFKSTRGAERYSLLKTDGSWLPTPPDYMPAVEPHWHTMRPFVGDTTLICRADTLMIPFSTDKNSEFYKAAHDVYLAVLNADSNEISMAKFWDDNPVVSNHQGHFKMKNKKMTPSGHWMAIAALAIKTKKNGMTDAAFIFSQTAVALADAFIMCWEAKYHYNTVRPITYIHDHISTNWQPILQTPPFPEFPSGHSSISAAAATVLTQLIGDDFAFTDSSEVRFGLPVRSFTSFEHAANEVAMSRFYGGIHFMFSNEVGTMMGRQIGEKVLEKMNVKSETERITYNKE